MRSGQHSKASEISIRSVGGGSFRKTSSGSGSSGISSDGRVATAPRSTSGASPRSTGIINHAASLKEFLKSFSDSEILGKKLQIWLLEKLLAQSDGQSHFEAPFHLDELQQFDFALEGTFFEQLLRMPSLQSITDRSSAKKEICLVAEDLLYAGAQGLWETFWSSEDVMPFYITGSHTFGPKCSVRKSTRGSTAGPRCVTLVGRIGRETHPLWEHIGLFVLPKTDIGNYPRSDGLVLSPKVMSQAVFYGVHMLLSRKYANERSTIRNNQDTAYVVLVDSQYGGIVRLKGDINKLDVHTGKVHESVAQWMQDHARVALSTIDKIWNRFGNANWGDVGARHLLLALFHSIQQCQGSPKKSIAEMATEHNIRLQRRGIERQLLDVRENGGDSLPHYQIQSHREIIEIEEDGEPFLAKNLEHLKLEPGTVLWLEDSQWQNCFKIHEDLGEKRQSMYTCSSLDEPNKLLNVYIGAHPSQLEPSWEDMNTWYQVQRQARVLNIMKQRGSSSIYIPQLIASGRILHPGSCSKQSPGGRCDHPWCGTPVLVTFPVGDSLDVIVKREGIFSSEEALKCCHDCLSALRTASSVGIQHGDINPEHIMRVIGEDGDSFYLLTEWGHAVLEDRDSPGISLRFSSTYALQEGKLCPASDAESLIYVLYFLCGGMTPQLDSIESALRWRERSWTTRGIQQQLGEVSAVLKAFADYVDSLCGTPYPVDYDIWMKRLIRRVHSADPGKRIDKTQTTSRPDDIAESSGASGS